MFKFIKRLFIKKRVNMLPAKKLSKLKELASDLKDEIEKHHQADPGNIDDYPNGQLFGLLDAIENQIVKIEKNNNIKL